MKGKGGKPMMAKKDAPVGGGKDKSNAGTAGKSYGKDSGMKAMKRPGGAGRGSFA